MSELNRFRFTKSAIEAVACPPDKAKRRVHDTEQPGLALLVTSNGAKTYYYYRFIRGKPMEVRIDSADAITPDQARTRARELNQQAVVEQRDPQAEKAAAREAATLKDLWETYRAAKKKGARTAQEEQGVWRRYLEPWANKRVIDITAEAIQKLHNRIAEGKMEREAEDQFGRKRPIKGGPTAARHTVKLLQCMFKRCGKSFGMAGVNPAKGVEREREIPCERYLETQQLPLFWLALQSQSELMQDLLKMALFTAQRRATLLTMRWDEVNLTFRTWSIPKEKMKGGRPHTVPLVPQAMEILNRRHKTKGEKDEWVFASTESRTGYVINPERALREVWKKAGIPPLSLHDLRRTTATYANVAGATEATIAGFLAHKHRNVTGVYVKVTPDAMRQAMEKAVETMLACISRYATDAGLVEYEGRWMTAAEKQQRIRSAEEARIKLAG